MPLLSFAYHQKSNSAYKALDAALHDLRNGQTGDIPSHLKDSHYKGAEALEERHWILISTRPSKWLGTATILT